MWNGRWLPSGHSKGTVTGICRGENGTLTTGHYFHNMFVLHFKVRIQTQKQFTGIRQCAVATFSKEGVGRSCSSVTLVTHVADICASSVRIYMSGLYVFLSLVFTGEGIFQRHVVACYHSLFDFLSGVWHIQELSAVYEPSTRGWLWSKHQTRGLPVWSGWRCNSGIGQNVTDARITYIFSCNLDC